jgi:hypothetical protein
MESEEIRHAPCASAQKSQGGFLLIVNLLISLLLGLLSLAGIVWIVIVGSLLTVDGLFMTLILLTLTGIFLLNVFLELRDRGSAGKDKGTSSKGLPASKAE